MKSKTFSLLLPILLLLGSSFLSDAFTFLPRASLTGTNIPIKNRGCSHVDRSRNGILSSSQEESDTSASAIRGCVIDRVADSLNTFTVTIDGNEADLGKFSQQLYKKILNDAKQERFQGFRPGTVPPHLLSAYKTFSMDEAAREAVLEAMDQNQIKAFEDARQEFQFGNISIPPPLKKGRKKKKKGGRKKKNSIYSKSAQAESEGENAVVENKEETQPVWLTFETMAEAVEAGWEPGQNFSFVTKNVKGQQLKDGSDARGIGGRGVAGFDLNQVAANVAIDAANNK
eukprot:CAMPEP_0195511844 /NCGR_PEP_ID=MMETSP0794_2-20130614/4017_1 /TAXON_ID=515487 /ORGANISM="Stephanopyxis turris, Strain CCMP 815" /LENGTH=285 /DNA_ID=CAMNT_0040639513 /DNA_START=68 /DNA_END=925 /DNA_ORIENTATION=-